MTESRPGPTDTAGSTATALLDAAESAFATEGIEGSSLRAIMRAAGANPAAVHYHFGSREALARAVLDRTLGPLNHRRLTLLGIATEEADGEPSLEALLDAIVRPDLEAVRTLHSRGAGNGRLIGLIYSRPSLFVKRLVEEHFQPVAAQFMPPMMRTLAPTPGPEIAWRVRWFVFGVLGALLSDDEATETHLGALDEAVSRLVSVSAAALRAPMANQPTTERTPT